MPEGSVTRWVTALKDGDAEAAQPLWERYHRQLISLARQKLQSSRRRIADEDDIVQNAFHSFFRGVAQNRFPQLNDRDNLWRLLVIITARKALDQIAHERTQKQSGGTLLTGPRISVLADADIDRFVGEEPTPEFAAQVAEQYERLLESLGEESLRKVAVMKMEGYTNDEVAERIGASKRTVTRKLKTIRLIWDHESRP